MVGKRMSKQISRGRMGGVFLLLSLLLVASSHASFLELPGLRARGMGGAFVAVADDGSAGLWNPAGIGQLQQSEIMAMGGRLHAGLDRDQLAYGFLSYVEPLPIGTVGLSGAQFASELYKESQLTLSVSRHFDQLYLGANVKGLFVSVSENEYTAIDPLFRQHGMSHDQWSVDLGLLWQIADGLSFAFAASDLNQPSAVFDTNVDEDVPITLRTGLHLWDAIALDLTYRTRELNDDPDWNVHLGTEWWLGDRLALRGGLNRDQLAAGASYMLPHGTYNLRFDYVAQYPLPSGRYLEDTWGSHLLALSLRFGEVETRARGWAELHGMPETAQRGVIQPSLTALPEIEQALERIAAGEATKQTYSEVGAVYLEQGKLEDAIQLYEQAAAQYPDELSFFYALAQACEQMASETGQKEWLDKAAQTYEEILKQDEGYQDVSLRLMNIHIKRGDAKKAFGQL